MSFLILILISSLVFLSEQCGITTHTEIAHRAASHYDYIIDGESIKKLIENYQSAFQAGNPYPDSYYPSICKKGSLADVSEDTHWVPFLNATIKYIQKKYPKPYNEDAKRLIVFTLGYISHQMADITWHSLGVVQGFLSAMGYVNFHGSFPKAHSVGDVGGDIVNQLELNTNYISDLGDWYVPYDDLYNIYLEYYGKEKITKTEIIECSSLLFLGRLGEQVAIALLYADYFKKSAFMVDRLNDYFLGGLDDMATWTQISWNRFFYMLENGVEKCKLDHNILYIDCNTNETHHKSLKPNLLKSIEPHFRENALDKSFFDTEINSKGVYIRSNSKYKEYFRSIIKSNYNSLSNDQSNSTYFTLNDYSNLGWALDSGDLNQDGSDDFLMGAPVYSELNSYQNGAVFGIFSDIPLKNLNVDFNSNLIIKPPADAISSRFGHSVLIIDINLDGFNDIIVSAPSYNLKNIKYEGRVYIYLGDKSYKYNTPTSIITCRKYEYCNLGWKLSKGDVNGDGHNDLIISSPYASTLSDQSGFVSVLFSKNSLKSEIDVIDLDWNLFGHMAYEWFGFSAKFKYGYLVIGAPQSRICHEKNCDVSENDIQAVGRVYIYKYPKQDPIMILNGNLEFSQFGYDTDLSYQSGHLVLAVSSVTEDSKLVNNTSFDLQRAGVVRIFEINENYSYNLISIIKSDRPYSGFGSKIQFFKYGNNAEESLFINSHMRSESIVLIDQVQEGRVFVFEGGKQLFQNITDNCPPTDLHPCPGKHAKLVLGTNEKRSRFGFDFTFLKTNNPNQTNVAISAIHADNKKSRLSGQVKIFLI